MERETKHVGNEITWRKKCIRGFRRFLRAACCAIAIYVIVVLVGLWPVNNDFEPTSDGIEVFLVSTSIHADVILPIDSQVIDWRDRFAADCFSGNTEGATHVAIGWGDRTFFVESETWADIRFSSAAIAVFLPSPSCLHVRLCERKSLPSGVPSVKISNAQYERLVEYVEKSFQADSDGGRIQIINAAHGKNDAFFQAHGSYHFFNTCNCWLGGAMKAAGIRTGWYTPLPQTPFLYLPD